MDDFISRKAAIECAIDAIDDWDGGWNPNRETVIRKYFEELPAVDAVPVIHASWIERDGYDGDTYYECAACQYPFCTTTGESPEAHGINYCPHCGAKMDGERRDSE